jgi:ABC-type branched-subunit amino acid transport system ATPase component
MIFDTLLAVNGVNKRFGGIQALRNVDLEVKRGTIHGLIGPNGAGKTTLFNVCSGYLRADSGRVRFQGEEILGLPPYQIARKGMIRTFQAVKQLGQMTIFDNMKSGTYRATARRGFWPRSFWAHGDRRMSNQGQTDQIWHLLRQVGLESKAQVRADSLSFGELRFLDVARALAGDPCLLLLDEPAAGLNNEEVDRLESLLGEMKEKQLTIVLIEHDVELVFRLCDTITVLDFGGVIATGPPESVKRDSTVMAAYLGIDLAGKPPPKKEVGLC